MRYFRHRRSYEVYRTTTPSGIETMLREGDYEEVIVTPKPKPKTWVIRMALFADGLRGTLPSNSFPLPEDSPIVQYHKRVSDWVEVTFTERQDSE